MNFRVPDDYRDVFGFIIQADEEYISTLEKELNELPKAVLFEDFITKITQPEDGKQLQHYFEVIFSLGSLLLVDEEVDIVVVDLLKDIDKTFSENIDLNTDRRFQNLKRLIQASSATAFTFKFKQLKNAYPSVLTDVKIFSDVRLLFDLELYNNERCGLVSHQLVVELNREEDSEKIYISADKKRLIQLRAAIDRALKKEDAIKNDYQSVISFIGEHND